MPQRTPARLHTVTFAELPDTEGIARRMVTLPGGVQLHVAEMGPRTGKLVVLVHGFPEFWWSWRHQLRALAAAGIRAVAPDLRGYGDSDKPKPGSQAGDYSVRALAGDIAALIKALQRELGRPSEPAVLVGHDWGGAISWAVPALHPEVVAKLAILNAPHPGAFRRSLWRHPSQIAKSWYIIMFQVPGLAEHMMRRDPGRMMARTLYGAAGNRKAITRDDVQVYADAIVRPGVLECALAYYRSMGAALGDFKALCQPIACPVLVLWGTQDPALGAFLAEDGRPFCTASYEIVWFADAGHWLQLEESAAVSAQVIGWATA